MMMNEELMITMMKFVWIWALFATFTNLLIQT